MPEMMRALVVTSLDGPDAIELREMPVPTNPDAVIIEVHAAGANFADTLMTRGKYQVKPEPPFIPGVEVAGIVRSAPASSPLKPGDRVAASAMGAFAEVVAAPPFTAIAIPDGMSFEAATSLPVNYQTAYFGLVWRGGLRDGETVVVHGASGGVGSAAIHVAKATGARVIAIARGADKVQICRDLGADDVIDSTNPWLPVAKELTGGRGVDMVYDPVGGEGFTDNLRALAPEGRVIVIGFAGGSIPEVKVNRLLLANTSVIGAGITEFVRHNPQMPHIVAAEIAKLWQKMPFEPLVGGRYPLERGADALRDLEGRCAVGKLGINVR